MYNITAILHLFWAILYDSMKSYIFCKIYIQLLLLIRHRKSTNVF
nr:MAG TPA: hypothetical protein [Caudoviricetes sp.]